MGPTKGVKKSFNSLPEFNPKVVLRDIMFAPVDIVEDENQCLNNPDLKTNSLRTMDSLWKQCGDGKTKGIQKCKHKGCKLRADFVPSDRIVSSSTQRIYDVVIPPGTKFVNCQSSNLIYLLTCSKCSLQYVGETIQGLNQRFSEH